MTQHNETIAARSTTTALPIDTAVEAKKGIAGRRAFYAALRGEYFLWALIAVLLVLSALQPAQIRRYPALVDWPTIATLTGLLTLTKGIELSGYLNGLAHRLMTHLHTQRQLALFLVAASALLATVLTNDIALFIVVPLTVSLRRLATLPIGRLVAFEALAVNAGSTLTPIGNPQNLFLWHVADVSFLRFTLQMLPLVAGLSCLLLAVTAASFAGKPIETLGAEDQTAIIDQPLLIASLVLYLPFIVLTDMHRPAIALAAVLLIFLGGFRRVLLKIDWVLIVVFILMFVDLRLVAELPWLHGLLQGIGLGQAAHLFLAGVVASQLISNVPAAILLAQYSHDWQVLAYAVNVGGFGFMLGSLANLIALRLAGERRAYAVFHLYSLPFLLVSAAIAYLVLFIR